MRRSALLAFLVAIACSLPAAAQVVCSAPSGDPSVTLCLENNNNGSTPSPFHIKINTNDAASSIDLLQVYFNGRKRWEKHQSSADIFLAAGTPGAYRVTAVAHDTAGHWFQSTVNTNVTFFVFVCAQDQNPFPQAPHTMIICQPIDGEIQTSPVHVSWGAQPDSGKTLQAVQVFVDGVSVLTSPPAKISPFLLISSDIPMEVGRHHLTVQGYDGTTPFKNSVDIQVPSIAKGCAPPAVQPAVNLCSLSDGQTVSTTLPIKAAASASTGITKIVTKVDGNVVSTVGAHMYVDFTTTVTPGPHTITVTATDYHNATFSRTVTVTAQ